MTPASGATDTMGLEFLSRVRRATLWLGGIAGLLFATYHAPAVGLGLAAGAAWSLVNLFLIETLVVVLTGPARGTPATLRPLGLALGGMLLLFAAGAALLRLLPPMALVAGFVLPFVVLTLKAAALLLMQTPLWRLLAGSPRRTGLMALGLGAVLWAVIAAWPLPAASPAGATGGHAAPAAAASVAEHGVAESRATEHGATGTAAEHGATAGPEKFPSFITIIARAFPDQAWSHWLHEWETIIFAFLIGAILSLVAWAASRDARMIPGRLQNAVEIAVEWLNDFVVGILGPKHGRRFVPFLGTQFIYIFAMNLFGLIPFMDSPTSSLNVTVALAVVVFLYAQYLGLRELGPLGYVDHMAGTPRSLVGWSLVPLMLPIHVLGEFAKPISLSARLFGNIFGEDMLLVAFASLGITVMAFTHLPFGLPLQFPFLFLALLTSGLQALVFTVLSTIYFLLMLPHEEHAGHNAVVHQSP